MRKDTYVPSKIRSAKTENAVDILAKDLETNGVISYDKATQDICRLLGWLCDHEEQKSYSKSTKKIIKFD